MTTINYNRKLIKTINYYDDGTYEEVPMQHTLSGLNHPIPSLNALNGTYTLSANTQTYNSLTEYIQSNPITNGGITLTVPINSTGIMSAGPIGPDEC
jgi:hypothetical protein